MKYHILQDKEDHDREGAQPPQSAAKCLKMLN